MKLKVTKTLAKYINSFVKKEKLAVKAAYKIVGPMDYPGGVMWNPDAEEDEIEYDRQYQVIMVYYPEKYYACPLAISTPMLKNRFKGQKEISEEDFKEALREWIEI